jgi:uncharacterized membrane protein YoaK (UPF0700 family)
MTRPSRNDRWLRHAALPMLAGGALALVAGYIDGVFFSLADTPVTHMTGSAARLSADLATGVLDDAGRVMSLLAAFMLGAAVSGVVVGVQKLRMGRRYGVAMMIEGLILAAAALAFRDEPHLAALLAAAAAGLQNAMASTYAGLIVRTTHITGIATDIGFIAGRWLRHRHVEGWRFVLLLILMIGFILGAGLGTAAALRLHGHAIWPPAAAVFAAGATYFLWRILSPVAGSSVARPSRP